MSSSRPTVNHIDWLSACDLSDHNIGAGGVHPDKSTSLSLTTIKRMKQKRLRQNRAVGLGFMGTQTNDT